MPKTLRIAVLLLSASLVLNIALGAFAATRYLRDRVYHQVTQLTETEPSEAMRTAFRQALRDDRSAFLGSVRTLRQARERQHAVLTAERLDKAALAQAQSDVRSAMTAFVEVLQRALRQTAEKLPDAERKAIPRLRIGAIEAMVETGEADAQ